MPGAKTKMRRPLKVPLTPQSIAILRAIQRLTGNGRYVFPSLRSMERPMSDNCLNAALRRLGYDNSEMTAHGFRAMACSLLNESGRWRADAIERQMGHCDSNEVRRAYARAEYWDERVRGAEKRRTHAWRSNEIAGGGAWNSAAGSVGTLMPPAPCAARAPGSGVKSARF